MFPFWSSLGVCVCCAHTGDFFAASCLHGMCFHSDIVARHGPSPCRPPRQGISSPPVNREWVIFFGFVLSFSCVACTCPLLPHSPSLTPPSSQGQFQHHRPYRPGRNRFVHFISPRSPSPFRRYPEFSLGLPSVLAEPRPFACCRVYLFLFLPFSRSSVAGLSTSTVRRREMPAGIDALVFGILYFLQSLQNTHTSVSQEPTAQRFPSAQRTQSQQGAPLSKWKK